MTPTQAQLCERLDEAISVHGPNCSFLRELRACIESQAKQIAELQKEIEELGLSVTGESFGRCAAEARIVELEAKVAAAEKATHFAGLVLTQHRNDGYPGDVDGDFLQRAALKAGLIEERTVAEPCGQRCSCAEALSESEFPTVCYFNTEAGKAAIDAAITAEDAREGACNT